MNNLVSAAPVSTTTVVVTVADVNDNAPTFFTNSYVGSVSESAHVGAIAVAGIRAFDLDAVSYHPKPISTKCSITHSRHMVAIIYSLQSFSQLSIFSDVSYLP